VGLYLMRRSAAAGLPVDEPEGAERPPTFVGMLLSVLGRDEDERRALISTIGPVWDGNEVWLIVAAGATFASFPLWYATLFSGFYLPLLVILVALILRGVAFEYRGKVDSTRWRTNWDRAILFGSVVPAVLWGFVFGNIIRGVPVNPDFGYAGGVRNLLNVYSLVGGLTTLTLFLLHGALFIALKTAGDIEVRARQVAERVGLATVVLTAVFLVWIQVERGKTPTAVTALLGGAALLGALVVNRVGRERWFSGVALAVVVLIPLAAFEAVTMLPPAAQHLQRGHRSVDRVRDVLDRVAPVRAPAAPAALPPAPYTVGVVGLRAHWPGAGAPALNGVDLELGPGRRVAVVGASGSGKTTLVSVLVRFLAPSAGQVTLNEVDITTLASDDVRRVIKLCAQDGHLFDTTIEENVRLARRSATPEALRAALVQVRLLEWVDSLPEGAQTPVGEHGARVSGGQRQRIALARALLADPPVLLLDEPAEHLDLATADALTADLLAATAGRTTLFVTHRLAGLEAVDEVVVLHAGRVIQRGSHAALITVAGPYRRMWDRERAALDLV
jgi:ABC-type multidrug transport system fused ATPase/permease subunit